MTRQEQPFPRRISFEFGGDVFNAEYDMRVACDRYANTKRGVDGAEHQWQQVNLIADWLVACLMSWDVPKSHKVSTLMPITVESFRKLPLSFLNDLVQAITEDIDEFAS